MPVLTQSLIAPWRPLLSRSARRLWIFSILDGCGALPELLDRLRFLRRPLAFATDEFL